MPQPFVLAILFLAIFTIITYFYGRKKNKWISGFIAAETEEALHPRDQEYVNIGGTIGFNSTYKLKGSYSNAKGTMALLPRQSILYLPIPLILRATDRYYLTIYSKEQLIGEGHLIEARYFRKVSKTITGIEEMRTREEVKDGKTYVLLSETPEVEDKLVSLLGKIERADLLFHFCCYRNNKNFYLHMKPVKGGVSALLGSLWPLLASFRMKSGGTDHGNAEGNDG